MNKEALKFVAALVIILAAVGGVLRAFFVTPLVVAHDGMAPTLLAGDTVLIWNGQGEPEFGSIAVCRHPAYPNRFVLGRYVAQEGWTVTSTRGVIEFNGRHPARDTMGTEQFTMYGDNHPNEVRLARVETTNRSYSVMQDAHRGVVVPTMPVHNGILLLGDNRLPHAYDSRSFRSVDPNTCIGTVFMRWKPAPGRTQFDNGWLDTIH